MASAAFIQARLSVSVFGLGTAGGLGVDSCSNEYLVAAILCGDSWGERFGGGVYLVATAILGRFGSDGSWQRLLLAAMICGYSLAVIILGDSRGLCFWMVCAGTN